MGPRGSRLSRLGLATIGLAGPLLAGACGLGGGHLVGILNERDRPVIVEVTTDRVERIEVPARSWGNLSVSTTAPARDWRIRVYRADWCRMLATLAFRSPRFTVHIDAAGTIAVIPSTSWAVPDGVALVDPMPGGSCRRPQAR